VDSQIAYGAPHKQDTSAAHGEPMGEEEIRLTKRLYKWPENEKFRVPEEVVAHFACGIGARGQTGRNRWFELFDRYQKEYPELAGQLYAMQHRQLPEGFDGGLPEFKPDEKGLSGRAACGIVLNHVAQRIPWLLGGSADLAPSTKTRLTFEGASDFSALSHDGRNLHFGVREHAMAAVLNGLSLCRVRPFGSGFLIFSDYARPAIRLGALMELPVIHIFTHDSISMGEDGPTHQPVEHLASLRAIPGIVVLRPADANEVADAWRVILRLRHEPAVLVLSRQDLPVIDRARWAAPDVARGAYVLADGEDPLDVLLIGTGSEVHLCLEAFERLVERGFRARVVSMPSWELFEKQDDAYKEAVLPKEVRARVSVEQASTFGWRRYVGDGGHIVGLETFGASAPIQELQKRFGFTVDKVVSAALSQIERHRGAAAKALS
jgi:transketolase